LSLATKRRVLAIALVLLALWPLAHRVLVVRYDISPWRFFGWAMYCQPKLPLDVAIYVRRDGVLVPIGTVARDAVLEGQIRAFARRREMWGALLPPDDLARRALEVVTDAASVEIRVRRLLLNPETALIESSEQVYRYPSGATLDLISTRD
jgi:hypothetical protein